MSSTSGKPHTALGYDRSGQGVFSIDHATRRRHLYTIGRSRSGKSTFLASIVKQDILAGRGVCLIDPHGDMAEEVIATIPRERMKDVIYFDAGDYEYPVAYSPLEGANEQFSETLVAEQVVATFKGIYPDNWGPLLEQNLRLIALSVVKQEGIDRSLVAISRMLEDADYREQMTRAISDPVQQSIWRKRFSHASEREDRELTSSTANKAGKIALSPVLRNILAQKKSRLDIDAVINGSQILVVNLAKGKIGEESASFLGSILISDIFLRVMQRADLPAHERADFFLTIDEFHTFTTTHLSTIVQEAGKYGLTLQVAHQNTDQIKDPKVLAAVIKNAGTVAVFNVAFDDAELLSQHLHPLGPEMLNTGGVGEFWCQTTGHPRLVQAFSPSEQSVLHRSSRKRVINHSRRYYGRERALVEQEFAAWWR